MRSEGKINKSTNISKYKQSFNLKTSDPTFLSKY